jgi:long-subunit acyl-CoA synthetase (AMP-forming)
MPLGAKGKILLVLCLPLFVWDLVLWFLTLQWLRRFLLLLFPRPARMQSVAVGGATATHGAPRRSPKSPDALVGSGETLYDMIRGAVERYGEKKTALVTRKFVELKKVRPTDRWPTKIYDDPHLEEVSYAELGDRTLCFGAGLRALGMEPVPELGRDQAFDDLSGKFTMVIFEDTSNEWTISFHGAMSQSITVATCYATLGEEAVVSAVNETGATTLLLNWKNAEKFAELGGRMPTLRTVIASTYEMPEGTPAPLSKRGSPVKIVTFDEVLKLGSRELSRYPPVPPKSSDVAVIMYTSGSTGTYDSIHPKCRCLPNQNDAC